MQIHWRRSFCLLRPRPFSRFASCILSLADRTTKLIAPQGRRGWERDWTSGVTALSFNSLPLLPLSGLRVRTLRTFAPTSLPLRSALLVRESVAVASLSSSSINVKSQKTIRYLRLALTHLILGFRFRYSIVKMKSCLNQNLSLEFYVAFYYTETRNRSVAISVVGIYSDYHIIKISIKLYRWNSIMFYYVTNKRSSARNQRLRRNFISLLISRNKPRLD